VWWLLLLVAGCGFEKKAQPPDLGGAQRVFVTSAQFPGFIDNLAGGVTGADLKCAQAAGGGTWRAWLSDDSIDAIDRVLGSGPWLRMDGQVAFARRPNELPMVKLNLDEHAVDVGPNARVWTGTGSNGRLLAGQDCLSWSSVSGMDGGEYGEADVVLGGWTDFQSQACNTSAHLYCFEVP
jgi:hypothetical protein